MESQSVSLLDAVSASSICTIKVSNVPSTGSDLTFTAALTGVVFKVTCTAATLWLFQSEQI